MSEIKPMEPTKEVETAYQTIAVINKLLAVPLGEQIYRREIKILFDVLELLMKPMFIYEP